jgi:NAD(P)-dependent dehydrogenase (short-subunit alcohol dehydrogenase family)
LSSLGDESGASSHVRPALTNEECVMFALRDKAVLITGGSSGIGRAAALRLAGQGACVAVAARGADALTRVAQEAKALGAEALAVPTDVTDAGQCRAAVEQTVARFGRLDVLLCSAGVSLRAAFADTDLAVLERVVRTNFFGTLYATYHAVPHVRRTRGSLVALSSLTGKRGVPSYAAYGAAKFAVQGLYESLRLELARDGVHVGVVSPGFVDTPLRGRVLGPDGKAWDHPPDPPFRVWPVEKCVDRILRLIVRRQAEALLPGFVRPLLALDEAVGGKLGDWYLGRKFDPAAGARPRPGGAGLAETV